MNERPSQKTFQQQLTDWLRQSESISAVEKSIQQQRTDLEQRYNELASIVETTMQKRAAFSFLAQLSLSICQSFL